MLGPILAVGSFLCALALCGCDTRTIPEFNQDSLKHPVCVGEINGQRLFYIRVKADDGNRIHYVYYFDSNSVVTLNRDETVGKTTYNRVEVFLNGKPILSTNLVENPK